MCGSQSPERSSPPSSPNLPSLTISPSRGPALDPLSLSPFDLCLGPKTLPWCSAATSMDELKRTRRQGSRVRLAPCHSIHLQKTCGAPWAKLVLPHQTRTALVVSPSRIHLTPCLATVSSIPRKTNQRWHQGATNPQAGSQPSNISILTNTILRCGSPSHEAPEPLFTGLPSYSETMATRVGGATDPEARMDR